MADSLERFRAFRLQGDTPIYVGTFEAANAKDAARQAVYANPEPGQHTYEVHVLRNTSVFETDSRDERFVDLIQQANTQQFFATSVGFEEACDLIRAELQGHDWVSSNEIHARLEDRVSGSMFGRVKSALGIEHRRGKDESGRVRYEWRLPPPE